MRQVDWVRRCWRDDRFRGRALVAGVLSSWLAGLIVCVLAYHHVLPSWTGWIGIGLFALGLFGALWASDRSSQRSAKALMEWRQRNITEIYRSLEAGSDPAKELEQGPGTESSAYDDFWTRMNGHV